MLHVCRATHVWEPDGARIISPAFLVQKLFAIQFFFVKTFILTCHDLCSLTRQRKVNSDGTLSKEQLKSYRLHFSAASYLYLIVSETMAHFRRIMEFRKLWHLVTFGDLIIDLSGKLTVIVSEWFFTSFRTLFSRFVLRRIGAELGAPG